MVTRLTRVRSLRTLLGASLVLALMQVVSSSVWAMPEGLALPCGGCHELVGGPLISLNVDATSVDPGAALTLIVDLRVSKPDAVRTGLWLTASSGTFQLLEPDTKLESPTSVLHSAARDFVEGQATLSFAWTAPMQPGVTEFVAWSVAGNGNLDPRDDAFTRSTFAVAYGCEGRAFFPDGDGDGFGDPLARVFTCDTPPLGLIETGDDCNDRSNKVSPEAEEQCNLEDDNCNEEIDENVTPVLLYPDSDGDGFGTNAGTIELGCELEGFSPLLGDCNDTSPAVSPGAPELLNGSDDDCDGEIDEASALPADAPSPPNDGASDPSPNPATVGMPPAPSSSGCTLVRRPTQSPVPPAPLMQLVALGLLCALVCRRRVGAPHNVVSS